MRMVGTSWDTRSRARSLRPPYAVAWGFHVHRMAETVGWAKARLRAVPTIAISDANGGHVIGRAFARPKPLPTLRICAGSHVHRMAGDAIDQSGGFAAAEIERQRTARVKGAAGGWIDRVRNLAFDGDALAAGHREIRYRAQ